MFRDIAPFAAVRVRVRTVVVQLLEMEPLRSPQIEVETIWRTILVTDARDSSKAYFSARAREALVRIERDRALFAQIAARHGGEEARDRGDGSMFAFCSPLEALRAAMAMQEEIASRNAEAPEGTLRLMHRMGLQMGQINLATTRVPDSETVRRKLSGDIVVTATRLEELCHPGEVCFSNDVYRVVRMEVEHEFRHLDATLKGFDRPMRCWSTRFDPTWERPLTSEEEAVRQRRAQERRLREKWEREQRERHMRFVALRCAAGFAAASLLFAGFRVVQTATGFDTRVSRAWDALLRSPADDPPRAGTRMVVVAPAAPERAVAPKNVLRKIPRAKVARGLPHARGRLPAVLRSALKEGDFETLAGRLSSMGLPEAEFQAVVDDAQRLQRAQEWLAIRLDPATGDATKGLPLEPPVAGMAVLTRADERGVGGFDAADRLRSVPYARLAPKEFGAILQSASSNGDAVPDGPLACAQSLAALRRRIGSPGTDR